MDMKHFFQILGAAGILGAVLAAPALADSDNWSPSKQTEVDVNRNANSGLGNGGERRVGSIRTELADRDLDPGNSGEQAQGGKNDGTWDN